MGSSRVLAQFLVWGLCLTPRRSPQGTPAGDGAASAPLRAPQRDGLKPCAPAAQASGSPGRGGRVAAGAKRGSSVHRSAGGWGEGPGAVSRNAAVSPAPPRGLCADPREGAGRTMSPAFLSLFLPSTSSPFQPLAPSLCPPHARTGRRTALKVRVPAATPSVRAEAVRDRGGGGFPPGAVLQGRAGTQAPCGQDVPTRTPWRAEPPHPSLPEAGWGGARKGILGFPPAVTPPLSRPRTPALKATLGAH